jgi:hypothetical protein
MAGFDKLELPATAYNQLSQQAKSGKAVSSIHTGLDLSMNKQWVY